MPTRRCGNEVRIAAARHNIAAEALSLEHHREIDAASVAWVRENASLPGIIEGRFLDHVLSEVLPLVRLINVTVPPEIRAARWVERRPGICGDDEVKRQDDADERFRAWAYPGLVRATARDVIEATGDNCEWSHLLASVLNRP